MYSLTLDHIWEKEFEKGKIEGERLKLIEIAKRMLKKGSSIEDVLEITELSIEEIEKIKNKMI